MASHFVALCFDATDPLRLARFWAGLLCWEMADAAEDGIALLPSDDTGFKIRFLPTDKLKVGQNRNSFRSDEHVAGGPAADGGEGTSTRRPAHGHRSTRRRGPCCTRRPGGQRILRHRAGQQLP